MKVQKSAMGLPPSMHNASMHCITLHKTFTLDEKPFVEKRVVETAVRPVVIKTVETTDNTAVSTTQCFDKCRNNGTSKHRDVVTMGRSCQGTGIWL